MTSRGQSKINETGLLWTKIWLAVNNEQLLSSNLGSNFALRKACDGADFKTILYTCSYRTF